MNIVDANILLSAIRSRNGASNMLVREMLTGKIPFAVSPVVALEYEDVLKRKGILGDNPWIKGDEIDLLLDAVFQKAKLVSPWFRFRPFLNDPNDDLYIECGLAAGATTIITSDRHFNIPEVLGFGLSVIKAGPFIANYAKRNQPT